MLELVARSFCHSHNLLRQIRIIFNISCWIAPNATVVGNVILHEKYPPSGSAPQCPIIIGERSNIQDGAVLHTDCGIQLRIGKDVMVGHQAMLHGCTVDDGSLIGIGATVRRASLHQCN